MATAERILIVLTSHDQLGGLDRKTGFYWEELASPYYVFVDGGYQVDIASTAGGPAPADPSSLAAKDDPRSGVARFFSDPDAMRKVQHTIPLEQVDGSQYAAIFLPGGHGVMWDEPDHATLGRLLGEAFDRGAVVAAVCHGPAGLVGARRADGRPVVEGRKVSSFTNEEEAAVGLTEVVPFLLESKLRELGAVIHKAPNFQAFAVRDGNLITGQNPASAALVANHVIQGLSS